MFIYIIKFSKRKFIIFTNLSLLSTGSRGPVGGAAAGHVDAVVGVAFGHRTFADVRLLLLHSPPYASAD